MNHYAIKGQKKVHKAMELSNFRMLEIAESGKYRLVREADLILLLESAKKNSPIVKNIRDSSVIRAKSLAELVREFRKKQSLTQEGLAKIADCSARTIKNVESGNSRKKPHFKTINNISQALTEDYKLELAKIVPLNLEEYNLLTRW